MASSCGQRARLPFGRLRSCLTTSTAAIIRTESPHSVAVCLAVLLKPCAAQQWLHGEPALPAGLSARSPFCAASTVTRTQGSHRAACNRGNCNQRTC